MRRVLIENNIYPEKLPAEEDVKKLEKQIKKQGEKLSEYPGALPSIGTIHEK